MNDTKTFRQVREHPRYWVSSDGEVVNKEFGRYITPELVNDEYLRVTLDGKRYYIHKLVATLFISNPHGKKYVVHLDGNHRNNKVTNLAWSNGYKSVI